MFKNIILKSVFFLIIFTAGTLFISTSLASRSATVTAVVGNVEILQQNQTKWTLAKTDQEVFEGSKIRTHSNSYCEVMISKGNTFRIKENSLVSTESLWNPQKNHDNKVVRVVTFKLEDGYLLAKLDNLPKDVRFNIETPVSIAGASGTVYSVSVSEKNYGKSVVSVLSKKVIVSSVNNPEKNIMVNAYKRVESAPWQTAILSGRGTGILSKAILGKMAVQDAQRGTWIEASASGPDKKSATLSAISRLSRQFLSLKTSKDKTLLDKLDDFPEHSEPFYRTLSKAELKGITEKADGTVEVTVREKIRKIEEVMGVSFMDIFADIYPIPLAEYGQKFGPLARVTTRRAAQVDAQRKLAETIYGTVIKSGSTLHDMTLKNDVITSTVQGIVRGAQEQKTTYYSDGSVAVTMVIKGQTLPGKLKIVAGDVFGQNYLSSPEVIEFENFEGFMDAEAQK
ncbi:MAG: FecR domain-containing protein [Candidatus Theseobacter exili]|nr:FecR domain-containing protein [Candidatus Theseobacter exili]